MKNFGNLLNKVRFQNLYIIKDSRLYSLESYLYFFQKLLFYISKCLYWIKSNPNIPLYPFKWNTTKCSTICTSHSIISQYKNTIFWHYKFCNFIHIFISVVSFLLLYFPEDNLLAIFFHLYIQNHL